ncbi:MAG: metallophosphoesterase [Clostridia bacterium]|nr:metallophosphoesterase [Clostridia bacterium]
MKKRLLGIILTLSMLMSVVSGFPMRALAQADINDTVDTWGVQDLDDFTSSIRLLASGKPSSGCTGCVLANTDYGFAYYAHNGGFGTDHHIDVANVYSGNYAVEFDMFFDDIDHSFASASTKSDVFRAKVTEKGSSGDTVLYYSNLVNPWNIGNWEDTTTTKLTIADDSGSGISAKYASAERKYKGSVSDAMPSYLNTRIIVDVENGKNYFCWKWNTSENWITVKNHSFSAAASSADAVTQLELLVAVGVGIDNFKVLRPKSNIVQIPQEYTYYDLVDLDAENMIVNPHFGTPVFTEPGASFTAEFTCSDSDVDFTEGSFDVYIENEYKSWYAASSVPAAGDIYLGTKKGYTVDITVPEDITPELLNLYMVHRGESGIADAEYFAPKSVQVTEELEQDFYSVAISDTHINKWGGPEYASKNARVLEFFNKAISIGGARYLSHMGDINDNVSKDRKTSLKETFVRAFEDSDVPLIVVGGNHEYDTYTYPAISEIAASDKAQITYEEYKNAEEGTYIDATSSSESNYQLYNTFDEKSFDEFFGTKTALITMGEDMVIAKHDFGAWQKLTGEGSVFIKLRDALAQAWDASSADYRIIYQHTENTGKENNNPETYGMAAFMSPYYHADYLAQNPQEYDIQYTGHYHKTYVRNEKVLTLGGGGKGEANWQGHGVISNFAYDASADKKWTNSSEQLLEEYAELDENGTGTYNKEVVDEIQTDFIDSFNLMTEAIEERFYNPNDGTSDYNIATVKNMIDFNFYDGRVRFIMQPGTYKVDGGELLSQYTSYDDTKTIVIAKVNIPAGSEITPSYVNVVCQPQESVEQATELVLKGAETGFVSADTAYLDIVSNTDIVKSTFTQESIAVKNNGFDTAVTVTYPDVKTARINFTDKLLPNSKYTVTLSDNVQTSGDMTDTKRSFEFVALPDEGVEFIRETVTTFGAAGEVLKNMTTTIDGEDKKLSDVVYENYVVDYTLAIPGYGNDDGVVEPEHVSETGSRLDWFIYTYDDDGVLKNIRPNNLKPSLNYTNPEVLAYVGTNISGGKVSLSESILPNPVNIRSENAYDFRVVKVGETWTLYVKNVSDASYDVLFTVSGKDKNVYANEGYTSLYTSVPGSHTYWYNYIVYPIEAAVSVSEEVGAEFDVSFGVQPENLDTVTVEGLGDITFEKLSPKTYKATMPDTWTKNSDACSVALDSVSDIYGNALGKLELAAEEYEVSFDKVEISAAETGYKINVTARKNWSLPENAKLVCASYDGTAFDNVQLIDAAEASYNGSDFEFTLKSDVSNPIIKVFCIDAVGMTPLAQKQLPTD